jgi:hypothetical protein
MRRCAAGKLASECYNVPPNQMVAASARPEIDPFQQGNFLAVAEELFPLINGIAAEFRLRTFRERWCGSGSEKALRPAGQPTESTGGS